MVNTASSWPLEAAQTAPATALISSVASPTVPSSAVPSSSVPSSSVATPSSPSTLSADRRLRFQVAAALVAVFIIWGSTYLGMRVALETLPPFLMGGVRFLIAGSLLYGYLRLRGAPAPTRREWGGAAITGVLLLAGGNGFVAVGQQWVSSGFAAVVVATMPLWVAVLGSFRGQRPTRGEWTGLLIGFAGVFLLSAGGELSAAHAGALVILLSPLCWAAGSLWSRTLRLPLGLMSTAAQMLAGGAAMLAVSALSGEGLPHLPSLRSVVALSYLIVFGSIVAFSAYGFLLRNTRPAIATSYAYVNPVVAIVLGAALGGEHAGIVTWAAAAIILAGVGVLHAAKHKSSPARSAAAVAGGR